MRRDADQLLSPQFAEIVHRTELPLIQPNGANAAKAARWAEGCRRQRRSADFVDYGKQPLPRSVVEDVARELGVSRATLYRLIELYKTFGTVDVLQPSATRRRSGTSVLPKATEQIIEETIHNVSLKPTRPGFGANGAANAISSRRPQQSLGNMQLAVRLRSSDRSYRNRHHRCRRTCQAGLG